MGAVGSAVVLVVTMVPLRLLPSLALALLLGAAGGLGTSALPAIDDSGALPAPVPAMIHHDSFVAAAPEPLLAPEDCIEGSPGDSVPGVIACGVRPPVCVADPSVEHHGHLVYTFAPGTPDPYAAAAPRLRELVGRANFVLDREAFLGWGEHVDLKVLCNESGPEAGLPVVSPLLVEGTDPSAYALAGQGYADTHARYWILDHRNVRGYAAVVPDQQPGLANANLHQSTYGVFGDSHATALHEIVHSLGAVLPDAPHWNPGGHCIDGQDVMCYPTAESNAFPDTWPGLGETEVISGAPPGGPSRSSTGIGDPRALLHGALFLPVTPGCEDRIHVDCNHDDYFNLDPPACDPAVPAAVPKAARELVDPCWLKDHWNLGARANLFLRFSTSHDPTVALQAPGKAVAGREAAFAAQASDPDGDAVTLVWDFGDGGSARGAIVGHTYAAAGAYTVTVRAWDEYEGLGTGSAVVRVVGPPPSVLDA